jgi:hypothetical protein
LMLAGISDCGRSIQYSHQHHDRSDYYSEWSTQGIYSIRSL